MKTAATAALLFLFLASCVTTGPVEKDNRAEGYYNKGLSYLQSNDYAGALAEFHRSIQTDPKYKMSYYAIGVVYDRQDKPQDAEKYFKDAIDIDSNFSDAYNMLGVVYSKQKRWKDALNSYNRALENKTYASSHITWLNIGNMYMSQREFAKAADAYRESKRLSVQDITIYRLGLALMESGKAREAVVELQEGVSLAPRNIEMRFALGLAQVKDGNRKQALSEFRRVVEIAPKSDIARTAQEYITMLGKDDAAVKKGK